MRTSVKTTTLFISYSGLLRAMRSGKVMANELEGALFYFGCTREFMLAAGVDDNVYRTVRAAIEAAEAEGRVLWRRVGYMSYWEQLNELLEANGLPGFENKGTFNYTYEEVIQAVAAQGLPYRVVWTD